MIYNAQFVANNTSCKQLRKVSNLLELSVLDVMRKKCVFNITSSLHATLPSKVIDKCKKKGLERRLSFTPKRYTISFQNGSRQNRIWNVERERQLKTLYSNDCTLIREAVILTPF